MRAKPTNKQQRADWLPRPKYSCTQPKMRRHLAWYVRGGDNNLSQQDRARFREHLGHCGRCAEDVAIIQKAFLVLRCLHFSVLVDPDSLVRAGH